MVLPDGPRLHEHKMMRYDKTTDSMIFTEQEQADIALCVMMFGPKIINEDVVRLIPGHAQAALAARYYKIVNEIGFRDCANGLPRWKDIGYPIYKMLLGQA